MALIDFKNLKDLIGLSKPLTKLIEVIAQGVGSISKPYLIKKTADAKAYEIEKISEAISKNQDKLQKIEYEEEKLSLASIDKPEIINEISISDRTTMRIDYQEQKRQQNLENITQKAANHLEFENNVSDEKVDEDWTTRFFNYAQDISNDEMQELWARILAGEVKRPNSFSLRTLELIRNLSKEEASIFNKVANYVIKVNNDALLFKGKHDDILEKFDIGFNDIALLQEIGLLLSGDFITYELKTNSQDRKIGFQFGDTLVAVEKNANSPTQNISIILFTKIGKELLNLIEAKPEFLYIQLFAKELKNEATQVKYGKILERNEKFIRHTKPLIDIPKIDK